MTTLFCIITKFVPSLYRKTRSERNSVGNPNSEIDISILTPQLTVTPEANRLVMWPGTTVHSAPATSSKPRIVVNLNFRVGNGI